MKLIKRKDQKQKSTIQPQRILIVKKQLIVPMYNSPSFQIDKIIKFSTDHWINQKSFFKEYESEKSKFLEYMCYFKTITHATKIQNCLIFYLSKQNPIRKHLQISYFVDKYNANSQTKLLYNILEKIRKTQKQIRSKFSKQKKNTPSQNNIGTQLINSIFIKNLKKLKNSPFISFGINIDFTTLQPYMSSVAISYSLLQLLKRNPQQMIFDSLKNKIIPDVFTNYGIVQWNIQHLNNILEFFENSQKYTSDSEGTILPSFQCVRELIDCNQNKMKAIVKTSFEIPLMTTFQIVKLIGEDQFKIENIKQIKQQKLKDLDMKKNVGKQ